MAHKDNVTFRTLIRLLDHPDNHIYVHMDIKNRSYNQKHVELEVRRSRVYHIQRQNITWGGFSQISVELSLLQAATAVDNYDYYHLLSGDDLPIKTYSQIQDYFIRQKGMQFVTMDKAEFVNDNRIQIYHFFQEKVGRNKTGFFPVLEQISLKVQKRLGIKRYPDFIFQKGENWFSITDEFARYILENGKWISKVFKYSSCCDEVFVQTLLVNSKFKDYLPPKTSEGNYHNNARYNDWLRGNPYVWREEDFDFLVNCDRCFARKFDENMDLNIIKRIERYCRGY